MTSKRLKKLQTEKLAISGIPEGRPSSIIDLPDDRSSWYTKNGKLRSKVYHRELAKLHYELVKLQGWIVDQGLKVAHRAVALSAGERRGQMVDDHG